MEPAAFFPATYAEARQRFRAAAEGRGWELAAHPLGGMGPDGEELAIDVALGGSADSPLALVVSSGLHGAEGPFGTAVQLAFLENPRPVEGVRLLFLHALNPFGYAWSRRFDEENVDPNRSFLLAGEEYTGSPPGYRRLDGLLNPRRPPGFDAFALRAWWRILRDGLPALREAVVQGQHDFPRGLFFGGHGPTRTQKALEEILPAGLAGCSSVLHLDYHTGLGPWATHKLLIDQPIHPAQEVWLNHHFGPGRFETDRHAAGVGYRTRGSFGRWCREQLSGRAYLGLCAEFGTYSNLEMLGGLRAENQAHHWGDPASGSTRRARARLRELFVPPSATWRQTVLRDGLGLIDRALAGLRSGLPSP